MFQHKMFYKTKSTSRQANESTTVIAQNDGLSKSNIQSDPLQRDPQTGQQTLLDYILTILL